MYSPRRGYAGATSDRMTGRFLGETQTCPEKGLI